MSISPYKHGELAFDLMLWLNGRGLLQTQRLTFQCILLKKPT